MSAVICSTPPVPFDVDCPEPLQNSLHHPGFVLLNMSVVTKLLSANVTVWLQCLLPLDMIAVQPLLFKSAT
jgi:hypothetical protein